MRPEFIRSAPWKLFLLVGLTLALGAVVAAVVGSDHNDGPDAALAAAQTEQLDDHDGQADHAQDQAQSDQVDLSGDDEAISILHHWQALLALQEGEVEDARHHVDHIIGIVSGDHRVAMQEIAVMLDEGDPHDAEHDIAAMLVGAADVNVTAEILHLQMALAALGAERPDEAVHHVRHFLDTATGDMAHDGEAVLASLQAADTAAATDGLSTMVAAVLAVQPTGEHVDDPDHEATDEPSQAAEPEHEDDDHAAEQSSSSEAWDPEDARTIAITMTEFAFGPNEIHVKRGETVRLLLINEGSVLHDITAETFHGQAQAVGSAEHEDSTAHAQEHAPVFHAAAVADGTVELLFVATEVGEFDLFCSVPGHKELGMTATLIVEEA